MPERIPLLGWNERARSGVEVAVDAAKLRMDHLPVVGPPGVRERILKRGPIPAKDPTVLEIGKWAAVVLAEDLEPARRALQPLVQARAGVAWTRGPEPGFLVLERPGTDTNADRWLKRLQQAAGGDMPHYLLLVGGPDRFPFEIQRTLDQLFITGRLDTGDAGGALSWDACRAYAEKVARYESGRMQVARETLLYSFAIDEATRTAHQQLTLPLDAYLCEPARRNDWRHGVSLPSRRYGEQATSEGVCAALRQGRPSLVFTASHGIEFPADPDRWGALTDSTFAGAAGVPLSAAAVPRVEPFAAGAVFFAFACFSAGVPRTSVFSAFAGGGDIEGAPFTAPLPRALLAHPEGPVAFIGHVDRVTDRCFTDRLLGDPLAPFSHFLDWSLGGHGTLGQALSSFRDRGKAALERLTPLQSPVAARRPAMTDKQLVDLWLLYYDYTGFVLLGDPAIRLHF